jgi:hypothetical protein
MKSISARPRYGRPLLYVYLPGYLKTIGPDSFQFIAYVVLTAIYNLTLHPLAKYPGPLLWRISPIPSIVSLLRGRIAFEYKLLHDKYGPVVRVMPNELSFNTAKAWDDIYGHRVGLANMEKDPIHVGAVEAIPGATNLTMAPAAQHARQRRALAHAFSKQALMEQEPILKGYVNLFVERLGELAQRGEPVNMVSWFNFCTFDIIGDLSFGEPFGCLREGMVFERRSMRIQRDIETKAVLRAF